MTSFLPFYYDITGFFQNDKSFMITGKCISFLIAFLNSPLFRCCFNDNFPNLGEKGRELRKLFFDKIPVLEVTEDQNDQFKLLIEDLQQCYTEEKYALINQQIYTLYLLTNEEIAYVNGK